MDYKDAIEKLQIMTREGFLKRDVVINQMAQEIKELKDRSHALEMICVDGKPEEKATRKGFEFHKMTADMVKKEDLTKEVDNK